MSNQNNELAKINKKYYENIEKLEFENKKLFFYYNGEVNIILNFENLNTNVFLLKIQML